MCIAESGQQTQLTTFIDSMVYFFLSLFLSLAVIYDVGDEIARLRFSSGVKSHRLKNDATVDPS